jgi:hypothetical protein
MSPSPYNFSYWMRATGATLVLIVLQLAIALPFVMIGFYFVAKQNPTDHELWVEIGLAGIGAWLLLGFYYIACRFLAQPFSEPKVHDTFLSRWTSNHARMKIDVYRSGWGRTYSKHNVFRSRGKIFLGFETVALSQSAFSFLLFHEIAHLKAKGGRVRRLTSLLLRYIDSMEDLRSKRSVLLERKTPAVSQLRKAVWHLFRRDVPLRKGIFWLPVRIATSVLISVEPLVNMIIGPIVKKEEFYADAVAAEEMGSAARRALLECALLYEKIEGANKVEAGLVLSVLVREWAYSDLQEALNRCRKQFAALPVRCQSASWYPTWKERYLAIHKIGTAHAMVQLAPLQYITELTIGDNMVLSNSSLIVRAYPYIHPVLVLLLTVSCLAFCLQFVLLVAFVVYQLVVGPVSGDYWMSFVASTMSSAFLVPSLATLSYGFLLGEDQFVINKRRLNPGLRIHPDGEQTDNWLSAELPKSLRTRTVLGLFGLWLLLAWPFIIPTLVRWLGPEAETREAARRLGKISRRDRISLIKSLSFGPYGQLVNRDYAKLKKERTLRARSPLSSNAAA